GVRQPSHLPAPLLLARPSDGSYRGGLALVPQVDWDWRPESIGVARYDALEEEEDTARSCGPARLRGLRPAHARPAVPRHRHRLLAPMPRGTPGVSPDPRSAARSDAPFWRATSPRPADRAWPSTFRAARQSARADRSHGDQV